MKILVIGDLHGQMPKIHFKEFDCIIQVGDVCDDSEFRPYIKKWFKILIQDPETEITAEDLIIDNVGKKGLNRFEKNSLKRGREILKFLNSFGKPVFFVPGNWDQSYGKTKIKDIRRGDYNYIRSWVDRWSGRRTNPVLLKNLKNVRNCHHKNQIFNKVNFVGFGLSNAPEDFVKVARKLNLPKGKKKIVKGLSDKIYNNLLEIFKKRNKKFPIVFISHNVPYNTKLDLVLNKTSPRHKTHGGSIFSRKLCQKYNPLLCISGHMHEHFGKDKLGKTTVVNAGFGKHANVLIDLDEKKRKIRKIEFYKGYKKKKA